jgi:steroid 5-alpha reductase family enzyme
MLFSMFLTAAIAVFVYMTALFIAAQVLKNNSIVDIAWGIGFIVVVAVLFIRSPVIYPAKALMMILILIWGLRLSVHIFLRNAGKPEDFRYAKMRKDLGKDFLVKSFFYVFMLQGLLMLVVSFSATALFSSPAPRPLNFLDILGVLVFLAGFFFETVGDYQLAEHIRNPKNKGKLMTGGLWSLTRHPNYFGEATMWWGVSFIALSSANGWAALISPVVITYLLLFVSGVPLLEKKYAGRPDWEAYKKKTPVFFPWQPKNH